MMEDDPNLATSLEDTSLENKIDSDIMTPLLGLPLPNSLLRALNQQGCVYLEDVDDQKLEKLGGNTKDVLAKTGKYVKKLEFISGDKVQESGLISTFSSCVDSILNGGVHLGEVLEILGEPGSGCSQLCQQIAIDAAISNIIGDSSDHSKVLYIDCEGGLYLKRLKQIASAAITHLLHFNKDTKITPDEILSNINIIRCTDYVQLLSAIRFQAPNHNVIIVDSITTHFRHEFDDMRKRTRILASLSLQLHKLSRSSSAIVLVNQLLHQGDALHPCLGETWSGTAQRKVLLQQLRPGLHSIVSMKSVDTKTGAGRFVISSKGVRDLPQGAN